MLGLLISFLLAPADTVVLKPAVTVAVKQERKLDDLPSPSTFIGRKEMAEYGVINPKSAVMPVPLLHLPDYGASLTSTIYMRGLGSRMDNPVLGLYMDDFPVLDKNAYDFDYLDMASVSLLRGPQGTLYGRNAMCGVLSLRTLGPDDEKGFRASLEYGSSNAVRTSASWYGKHHVLSAGFRHTDGYFTNSHKNALCDPFNGGMLRWKWEKAVTENVYLSHLLQASLSSEGGFAYGAWKEGVQHLPDYNDEAGYKRLLVLDGFKARIRQEKVVLDAMVSAQVLWDDMKMDQDYTPASVFTLEQRQLSGALTAELIARPSRQMDHWKPVTGFFGFFKGNRMLAPVHFKRDGIQSLILGNANANIPDDIGYLDIPDDSFPVNSRFGILSWNAALYHESVLVAGNWQFTLGVRLDYEGAWMAYDCTSALHYQFFPTMQAPKGYEDSYEGTLDHHYWELLPKVAVLYDGWKKVKLFASLAKGYRAGGFNTQIFSDILQNRMMNGLMADLGVYLDRPAVSVGAGNTEYKPEEAWNVEAGIRIRPGRSFRADVSAFVIDAVNQQLTVFPPGLSTGRMMTNAGRSLSYGVEAEADWTPGKFHGHLSYGWNRARFTEYSDGNKDYAGMRIPYSPEHTLFVSASYKLGKVELGAHVRGVGPIAWNEANTLEEPFYLTLGAQAVLSLDRMSLYVRGENLTGTCYHTFYFKSMGNEFFQLSKPRLLSIGIQVKI